MSKDGEASNACALTTDEVDHLYDKLNTFFCHGDGSEHLILAWDECATAMKLIYAHWQERGDIE